MTGHFLTDSQVTVVEPNECQDQITYHECRGELRGSYTWAQENPTKNYVLFILSARASISAVNLTYSVDSMSEKPKVSFCAAGEDTTINSDFGNLNLKCQEVAIEPTNNKTRNRTVHLPFTNSTSKIVMEVITQGIKASFTATSVEFFGNIYEAMGK